MPLNRRDTSANRKSQAEDGDGERAKETNGKISQQYGGRLPRFGLRSIEWPMGGRCLSLYGFVPLHDTCHLDSDIDGMDTSSHATIDWGRVLAEHMTLRLSNILEAISQQCADWLAISAGVIAAISLLL